MRARFAALRTCAVAYHEREEEGTGVSVHIFSWREREKV